MGVETIVVGVDGSVGADGAVRWAADLAAALGASVVAVHAYSPLENLGAAEPPLDFHQLRLDAEARLHDEWCAPLATAGVPFRSYLAEDEAVAALLTAAVEEDADLLVIGSHGASGWRERFLGRTASGLPERAGIPVVVVPQRPPS